MSKITTAILGFIIAIIIAINTFEIVNIEYSENYLVTYKIMGIIGKYYFE